MDSRKRSWLFRVTWPVTSYLVTNTCVFMSYLFFNFFSRLTVIGRENIPADSNSLIASNHQSMIDSWLIGMVAFFPKSLLWPSFLPWSPAAEENFFRNPILSWFAYNWRCIPVKRGRKDVGAIFKMSEAIKTGRLILFPEGTRSRDGSVGKCRSGGAGLLVLETHPTVIPVCLDGMADVLPIGSLCPKMFKRVYVYFGEPLDLSEFYAQEQNKEVARAVMALITDRIRLMKTELEEIRRHNELSRKVLFASSKKYNSQKV